MLEILFWLGISIVVYTYIGYGLVITFLAKLFPARGKRDGDKEPAVSLIVAAWNEADWIEQKAENMLALDYPPEKMQIIFVTDGSDDGTPQKLEKYADRFTLLHKDERAGKIAAMERAVTYAENPILIFSDANAMLNPEAVRNIVKHYEDQNVGAVAGEKRILMEEEESASGAGEGIYWKYEGYLKARDYEFYSVVGAAGELFSVRRELFEPVEPDTLLDDFIISLRVASRGYRVAYAPEAFASERPSADSSAEMKRKVRISAGGLQSIVRLRHLLNPFGQFKLWFQYVSHRVLRWTLAPLMLPLILLSNIFLVLYTPSADTILPVYFYQFILVAQLLFYTFALGGYILEKKKMRAKILFVPFYFTFMNISVFLGLKRFLKGSQTVIWERAERAK